MNSTNKRRRLNDNASILSKPFRSPLKINGRPGKSSAHDVNDDKHEDTSPSQVQEKRRVVDDANNPTNRSEVKNLLASEKDVVQLQREYAALCQQIRHRRQTLDILQRSLTIRTSNQQKKLDESISKWKIIARDAADEVYDSMNARIKDMGGLQAMKKQSQDFANQWSNEKDSLPLQRCKILDDSDDCSTYLKDDHKKVESDVEEAEFNMTTMLRQLNIDPDLLGFDAEINDWRE